MLTLPAAWADALADYTAGAAWAQLSGRIAEERRSGTVFPPEEATFRALELTKLEQVKVVILGQDPYHDFRQAQGLAFSVPDGVKLPPSLKNIFRELADDLHWDALPERGDLSGWAEQGVLLLNTVLTVRAHEANSHRCLGWEEFTDAVIRAVNALPHKVVFLLWGAPAQKKKALIDTGRHAVLEAAHPSPLSAYRGFFGSRVFSRANAVLTAAGESAIDWGRRLRDIEEGRLL